MDHTHSFTIQEYMHTQVPVASPSTTLRELVRRMLKANERWVVVVDEHANVLGVISSLDVIKYIVPDYMEEDVHLAHFTTEHSFVDRVKKLAVHPVEKFMTKNVRTVQPNESLLTAATLMSQYGLHRLPVTDGAGKLIGYIGQTAMANAMSDVFFTDM